MQTLRGSHLTYTEPALGESPRTTSPFGFAFGVEDLRKRAAIKAIFAAHLTLTSLTLQLPPS